MNPRFYVICAAVLLALGLSVSLALGVPFLSRSNVTATVHGATYAGDTLEPLNDTVISLNSNPGQSIVAKNGTYSFELIPGDYIITARCYRNNTLVYSKETALKIEDDGNYVMDLLLYPAPKNQTGETTDKVNSLDFEGGSAQKSSTSFSIIMYLTMNYLPILLAIFLLLGGGYILTREHTKTQKNDLKEGKLKIFSPLEKVLGKSMGSAAGSGFGNSGEAAWRGSVRELAGNSETDPPNLKKLPLASDLNEVLNIIRGNKGRITQKELRSNLDFSEVKVSLLLSELEKRGLIRKLKNGRENVVVLLDEAH